MRLYVQFEEDELQKAAADIPIIATLIVPPSMTEPGLEDEPPAPPVSERLAAVLAAMLTATEGAV